MFQTLISSMLGPSGNYLLKWYVENSFFVNGIVVLLGILVVFAPRYSKNFQEKLHRFWDRTPFALAERDRRAIEAARKKWSRR
jgi:hypothetical protein